MISLLSLTSSTCEGSMEQKASNGDIIKFPTFLEELHLKITTYDCLLAR